MIDLFLWLVGLVPHWGSSAFAFNLSAIIGDGDFYDSLNLLKNILRKELWVVGMMHLKLQIAELTCSCLCY